MSTTIKLNRKNRLLPRVITLLAVIALAIIILLTLSKPRDPDQFRTSHGRLRAAAGHDQRTINESLLQRLEREVRILCWITTTSKNHKTKAIHVKRTWGRRCNRLLFFTSAADDELETVILPVQDTYEALWGKTREAFRYIYENHYDEADWFMKADDDTYVIMENLRYLLYPYSPELPIFFGYNLKLYGKIYMSGGGGYVLSRAALRRYAEVALNDSSLCKLDSELGAEDFEMGICLKGAGVHAGDHRDKQLLPRFYALHLLDALPSVKPYDWLAKMSCYQMRQCRDCVSEYLAAFHYVTPAEMYLYEYLTHELDVHGRPFALDETLPPKINSEELVIAPCDNLRIEAKDKN